jgi:pimeloyl-ACP methyl ester carboxylesterase
MFGSDFHAYTVVADGFEIGYERGGSGDPVIVLHHAGGPRFTVSTDRLAEHCDVIMIEMPGWGPTRNERTTTLEEMAETIAATIEAIGVAPCHVLGSSFGGAVAVRLVVNHPELVRRLMLESPSFRRSGFQLRSDGPPEDFDRAFRSNPERLPRWQRPSPELVESVFPMVRTLLTGPELDEELDAKLERCQVPTLVMVGDDDGVIPPASASRYIELMPNATLVCLEGAAHDIQGDRPEDFAELAEAFFRGGELVAPSRATLESSRLRVWSDERTYPT